MAILKNTVLVNNGNTGWTTSNVLDALEEAVADLNWNSGTQRNGVPTTAIAPGDYRPAAEAGEWNNNWLRCGGPAVTTRANEIQSYAVADTGSAYYFQRYYSVEPSGVNTSANLLTINQHSLQLGDTVTFYAWSDATGGDPTGGSLSNGQTLYVVPYDATRIYLADSAQNAELEIYLSFTVQVGFALLDDRHTDNTNIYSDFMQGDSLFLWSSPDVLTDLGISHGSVATSNPMFLQDTGGDYDADRVINFQNYENQSQRYFPLTNNGDGGTNNINVSVNGGDRTTFNDTFIWNTYRWDQTHDNVRWYGGDTTYWWDYPNFTSVSYHLVSQNDATYSVEITVLPNAQLGQSSVATPPHWDYTVPASGTRSTLDLRFYRRYDGYLYGVNVLNLDATGWSDDEVFTVPGDQIGGVSPDNDVTFGVNTNETFTSARDGIPCLKVTSIGAGVNAYQKSHANGTIVFRLESDANKKFGTTYYSIKINSDHELVINSGIGDVHNVLRQSATLTHKDLWLLSHWRDYTTSLNDTMRFPGYIGLDIPNAMIRNVFNDRSNQRLDYATSSTPTAYPLKLVTYRAQAPQDTDYVVFQFIQTINGNDLPYASWFFHKGTQYGNGIWDRDDCLVSSWTTIYPDTNEAISFSTKVNQYTSREEANTLDQEFESVAREGLYGYLRGPYDNDNISYMVQNNMYEDNFHGYVGYYQTGHSTVIPYFRHDDYDERQYTVNTSNSANSSDFVGKLGVGSASNFYRPLKGLPLAMGLAPQPYYMPDDFVCIMFNINPGQVIVSPGDTIEISPSEIYEVICRSYVNSTTSYDGISQNTTKGIVFAARTT